MGRTYAGILGPIAFLTVIARHLVNGGNAESAVLAATLALFAFAAIGHIVGYVAERTIVDAIEARFHAGWLAEESAHQPAAGTEPEATGNDAAA